MVSAQARRNTALLWERMLSIDPDSWARRFGGADCANAGNPAFVDWCLTISHLSGEQIEAGLEFLRRGDVNFNFVNQNQFYRLCGGKVLGSDNAPQYGPKFARLEAPRTPDHIAKAKIAELRETLANKKAEKLE